MDNLRRKLRLPQFQIQQSRINDPWKPPTGSELCDCCSALEFRNLRPSGYIYRDAHVGFVASLGTFLTLLRSNCTLCALFVSLLAPHRGDFRMLADEVPAGNLSLYAFKDLALHWDQSGVEAGGSESQTFYAVFPDYFFPGIDDTEPYENPIKTNTDARAQSDSFGHWEVTTHLMPRGWITQSQPSGSPPRNFGARTIQRDALDYDRIRGWLAYCAEHHSRLCESPGQAHMTSFRVIDCKKRILVPAPPECKYVALSYVWGTKASALVINNHLPSVVPQVIEDSIAVSQKLGFKYLWVDRFCISQDNPSEKHQQIQQMNLIYSNAQLTIIDAANSDPSWGLPGVSRNRAFEQPSAHHSSKTLISSLPDVTTMIQGSKWLTRGWTYQEALLSKRKLVVTDYQAYFECSNMHCYEAVSSPPCQWVTGLQYGNCACRRSSLFTFGDAFPPSLAAWKLVVNYTRRTLTHHEDILDAIYGVIREFQHLYKPFYFHWGIPILGDTPVMRERTSTFKNRVATALCWRLENPGPRRPGFPSWSWTGWIGAVSGWVGPVDYQSFLPVMVHCLSDTYKQFNLPLVFEVEHEREGKRTRRSLEEHVSSQPSTESTAEVSPYLIISSYIIRLPISLHRLIIDKPRVDLATRLEIPKPSPPTPAPDQWWAKIPIDDGQFIQAAVD